jgi:hypothetical protein
MTGERTIKGLPRTLAERAEGVGRGVADVRLGEPGYEGGVARHGVWFDGVFVGPGGVAFIIG